MNPHPAALQPILLRAAMVADGAGLAAAPGALLVNRGRIIAAGSPQALGTPPADTRIIDLPSALLIPGLVNAHCHLDLSHIGPIPFPGDFVSWVDHIRINRALTDESVAASVQRGSEMSRAGGTAFIGDIAGVRSLAPVHALRASGLPGVSYLEVFGLGRRQNEAIARMKDAIGQIATNERGVRLGVQPHAPYSCGLDVYRAAASTGLPLATHLAETLEELLFVEAGSGPLAEMIKRLGVWDESIRGNGMHAVEHLRDVLSASPFIAAHLNYIADHQLELLASWPVTVAYCPRASAYFGHPRRPQRPHRYRQMLEAGVQVALGTDSLVCLDTADRISVLDEMRFLHRRDSIDPLTLLRMATVTGARGLGIDPGWVTFATGPVAGILAVEIDPSSAMNPLKQAMLSSAPPRWVVGPVMVEEL